MKLTIDIEIMAKVQITELVLRDGHQSLIATRMRTEDMLPICTQLDAIGFWSLEAWGGATFDTCVRFLKEDPWERLTKLRKHSLTAVLICCYAVKTCLDIVIIQMT